MRIVTLLPSATEIVCSLGLLDQLVGVTHECDFPSSVTCLPRVTRSLIPPDASSANIDKIVSERLEDEPSLYALNVDQLTSLRPDLIITQSLCQVCAVAESEVQAVRDSLALTPTVLNLNPMTLDEVLASIAHVAAACGVDERGEQVVGELRSRINRVAKTSSRDPQIRVALLEWLDPPFAAGHWNPTLVRLAGGVDVLGAEGEESRRVEWSDVAAGDPDSIVVACCGYDVHLAQQDVDSLRGTPGWECLTAVRMGRVHVLDGSQYFNRPGPRLVDSLELLAKALHLR